LPEARRIVREVAATVGLVEGESGVRAVIAVLARLEPVSIRRVSHAVELPVPIVASICGELRKRDVVSERRPAQLTATGRELFAEGALRLNGCGAPTRERALLNLPAGSVRDLARVAKIAPPPRMELDQCHCTVETKLRRVLALHEADALVGRRILVLGDDDLTSLAVRSVVRRFGSASTVANVTVVDVDLAVVAFLRHELVGSPFPVSCLQHDLREPLPPALVHAFDTVVTDPPYTVAGARLFLSRAADALDGAGDVFFSFGSRRPGASLHVQRAIGEMGFVIRRLARDFNEYVGAGVLGGTSHLYHLAALGDLEPVVTGTFAGPLYTAET
jgi:predicted methyltransferase